MNSPNDLALKELRVSESRYRRLFETARDGILILNADSGQIEDVNPYLIELLGYSYAEFLGKKLWEVGSFSDRAESKELFAELQLKGYVRYEDLPLKSKDGEKIAVEFVSNTYDCEGIEVIQCNIRNIAERKLAETRQRLAMSVFDNTSDGIFITDENKIIVEVNRAFTETTGYSEQMVIGKTPRVLRSNDHDDSFYDAMQSAIDETGNWQGEIWNRRKNNELYCEHLSISSVRDVNEKITNYCAIFSDITKRKVAEAELLRLNIELEERVVMRTQELERSNRELDAFSYSVAHDLRAPLRAICCFSSILINHDRAKLDVESLANLRRIQAGAERMNQLITDLLDLAHISRQVMHPGDYSLSALADSVVESLVHARPERTVSVKVQPDMRVLGDQGLVRIALDNLIGNAWKFTARNAGARIEVGQKEHNGEVAFFVRDNGAGFDMQYAGKLFGAFERLHGQQEFEGTGIGLSIVQRICSRHGGRIWAEGKVGQGATFYFTQQSPT